MEVEPSLKSNSTYLNVTFKKSVYLKCSIWTLVQNHSSDASLVFAPTKKTSCDVLQLKRLKSDCQTSSRGKKKAPVDKYVEADHIYNLVCEKGFTPYIRVLLKTSHILYIYIYILKRKCSTCVFCSCTRNVLQESAGIKTSKRLTF